MHAQPGTTLAAERPATIAPRLRNPAAILPDAGPAIQSLAAAAFRGGVPRRTLELVHLRVSQINGCSACVDSGSRGARQAGESDERLFAVVAWRHASCFTDSERAALALAEEITRLADRADAVPDEVWNDAARHYDEKGLAALVLWTATSNLFNRLNVSTRQTPGSW